MSTQLNVTVEKRNVQITVNDQTKLISIGVRSFQSRILVQNSALTQPSPPGEPGKKGDRGDDGREVEFQTSATHIQWRYVGEATWTDLVLLEDIEGPQGEKGDQGDEGERGTRWSSGAGVPGGGTGLIHDYYLDSVNGDYYRKTALTTWVLEGNLKGADGTQGVDGAQGEDGKSAYEIWLDLGNVGDEQDFIDDLKPPPIAGNLYTYFAIWAEESGSLTNGVTEWSYGNGDETPSGSGIVMGIDCELVSIGGEAENGDGNTDYAALKNGTQVASSGPFSGLPGGNTIGLNVLSTPISYLANDIFNFQTITAGSGASGRTVAWFRVANSVAAFTGPAGPAGLQPVAESPYQPTGMYIDLVDNLPSVGDRDPNIFYVGLKPAT